MFYDNNGSYHKYELMYVKVTLSKSRLPQILNIFLFLFPGQHHRNHENMEYYYQLEIWKGNINGVLRVARQREELSDWLVAMAPMGE